MHASNSLTWSQGLLSSHTAMHQLQERQACRVGLGSQLLQGHALQGSTLLPSLNLYSRGCCRCCCTPFILSCSMRTSACLLPIAEHCSTAAMQCELSLSEGAALIGAAVWQLELS